MVLEDSSPDAAELASTFQLSPYFHARLMTSMAQAQELILSSEVDGIIRIRPDFSRQMRSGDAEVQVVTHGPRRQSRADHPGLRAERGASGPLAARPKGTTAPTGPVIVQDRLWFNEAKDSRYFLVPGLVVLVMTVLGALLTAWSSLASGSREHSNHSS